MSGYTRDTVLQAGRLQDGMHYLEKPFSPDVLVRRVREVLDQGPGSV
jgi:DNA-binding response OmpR family regulator